MTTRTKRRLFTIASMASLLLCVALTALLGRSFFVYDQITRSNWTAQPLDAQATTYAKQKGWSANFISRGEGWGLESWRGHLTFMHGLQMDPTSRWDEKFEKQYVNKPNWTRDRHSADDDGFVPGGNSNLVGFWGWLGFGDRVMTGSGWRTTYRWVTIPLWPLALASALLPGLWMRRRRRERFRRKRGLCLHCGYDLRASERCPECGAAKKAGDLLVLSPAASGHD